MSNNIEFKSICYTDKDNIIVVNKQGFLDYSLDDGIKKADGNIVMSKQLGKELVEILEDINHSLQNEINFIKKSSNMMNE